MQTDIRIDSLAFLDDEELYAAFSAAFASYELTLSAVDLKRMLLRRGFCRELSFGAFDADNRLVAFTFNGIGHHYDGRLTAYDTGTGTVPEWRGKGLAGKIFDYSLPYLRKAGVEQYLLEVLQHNAPAVSVYRKAGFKEVREFDYYNCNKCDVALESADAWQLVKLDSPDDAKAFGVWFDRCPSWQNSFDSMRRGAGDLAFYVLCEDAGPIAYGALEASTGDVAQIAVNPAHRRCGAGRALLSHLVSLVPGETFKVVNVDRSDASMSAFLSALGLKPSGSQYEMILPL